MDQPIESNERMAETLEEALICEALVEMLQDNNVWNTMDKKIRRAYMETLARFGLLG